MLHVNGLAGTGRPDLNLGPIAPKADAPHLG